MKLLGLGDSVMDAYRFQNRSYPGGNAVNVAVLARRAGAQDAGYLGILADDAPGLHFQQALAQEQVDLTRLRVGHGRTACNYIVLDADGDRQFAGNNGCDTVQNQMQLLLNRTDRDYIAGFDVTHTSIHSLLDDALPALAAKTNLSMDFSNDGFTHVNVAKLAPLLRFAFFSAGGRSREQVADFAAYAAEQGTPTVVFTRGSQGAYILDRGTVYEQPAAYAPELVDTLGAGDAFIAAFLVRYADTGGDVVQSAQAAAQFAAQNCGHFGAFGHPYDGEP
nr:PfkB family carbohydrate kinase [uncultured Butyricicoccus sp.]